MKYGWIPDMPDHRDLTFKFTAQGELPPKIDLRDICPPIYNQGELGSCTANAIAGDMDAIRIKQGKAPITPSRLFIYFNERLMEGTVLIDNGALIRDGIKSVAKLGACAESIWPYDIVKFKRRPTLKCYIKALQFQALKYERIDNRTEYNLKTALSQGHPIVFGFSVYESFETQEVAKTGIAPMPEKAEKLLGGHAVIAVGYDDATRRFLVRNSWGEAWGDKGYFTLPYEYLTDSNLSDDFWIITEME
jgi:C1A family cysteine protease